jgi:predicted nucleotidyltransferase component of viral defense system
MGGSIVILSREALASASKATGFHEEYLEKSIRLLYLLDKIKNDSFMRGKFALKGGTALNLFLLNLPRLSVDVDLNYIGSPEREQMLQERPKIEQALQAICISEGFMVRRIPEEHAGGKWILGYNSSLGSGSHLELDINFMLRLPLWEVESIDSQPLSGYMVKAVPVLDKHELVAGKHVALLTRQTARDLLDASQLFASVLLDSEKLRLAFVVYGGMSRKDWRNVSLDDISYNLNEVANNLLPTLRGQDVAGIKDTKAWADDLVAGCRQALSVVLPMRENENEFIEMLNDKGEIHPELLTADESMMDRIVGQPGLLWKAQNVREHKGR